MNREQRNMANQLLQTFCNACSHCGENAAIISIDETNSYQIICTTCNSSSAICDSPVEAIVCWNRRPDPYWNEVKEYKSIKEKILLFIVGEN